MKKRLFVLIVLCFILGNVLGIVGAQDGTDDVIEIVIPKRFFLTDDISRFDYCTGFDVYDESDGFFSCDLHENGSVELLVNVAFREILIEKEKDFINQEIDKYEGVEASIVDQDVDGVILSVFITPSLVNNDDLNYFIESFIDFYYRVQLYYGANDQDQEFVLDLVDFDEKSLIASYGLSLFQYYPDAVQVEVTYSEKDLKRLDISQEALKDSFPLQAGHISSYVNDNGDLVHVISSIHKRNLINNLFARFLAYSSSDIFSDENNNQDINIIYAGADGGYTTLEDFSDIPEKPESLEFAILDEEMIYFSFYVDEDSFSQNDEINIINFSSEIVSEFWLFNNLAYEDRFTIFQFFDSETENLIEAVYFPMNTMVYDGDVFKLFFQSDLYSGLEEFGIKFDYNEKNILYSYMDSKNNYILVVTSDNYEEVVNYLHEQFDQYYSSMETVDLIEESEDFSYYKVVIDSINFTTENENKILFELVDGAKSSLFLLSGYEKDKIVIEFVDADSGEVLKTVEETLIFE